MALQRTLLKTGASSGIGKEVAIMAAARGHTVIASAPTAETETDYPKDAANIAAALAGTPQDVALTEMKALESERPKAHYPITAMVTWKPRMARILPSGWWDKLQTGKFST